MNTILTEQLLQLEASRLAYYIKLTDLKFNYKDPDLKLTLVPDVMTITYKTNSVDIKITIEELTYTIDDFAEKILMPALYALLEKQNMYDDAG